MYYKALLTAAGLSFFGSCFSQSRLVINNNAFIVIDNSAKLVVGNPATNAITTSGTGGNIITESEFDQVYWFVGTSTGSYVMPFTSQTLAKIPFTANITGAGSGSGVIAFSTYPGPNWDNNTYRPSDVTHMFDYSTNSINNSSHVIDRFWIVDAMSYGAKPAASFQFTYLDPEWMQAGNAIVEAALGGQRFNTSADQWGDYLPQGITNPAANTTSGVPVSPANFFRSWTLSEITNPLAVDVGYFKSSCSGDALLLNWQTLSQSDVDHFEIEHYENGNYAVIGIVPAIAATGIQNYAFQSAVSREGVFNLVEVDKDGDRIVKSSLSASCVSTENVAVSYSGSVNGIVMSFDGAVEAVETLRIFDAAGKLVYSSDLAISNGPNTIVIPDLFLSNGMYMVHLKNGLNQINEKVIAAE